jgi:hemerythrin-like domain-containing protein
MSLQILRGYAGAIESALSKSEACVHRSGINVAKCCLIMQSDAPPSSVVRERFVGDHRELEDLLKRVLAAFEADDRGAVATLWSEFEGRLTNHLDAEDRHVIPRLFSSLPREARTLLEEHRHIRTRLSELRSGIATHVVRLETARGFIDELCAHSHHEEDVLYRWADEHLDGGDQSALVEALAAPLLDKPSPA